MVIRLEDATKRRNRGQRKLFSSLQRVPLVILLAGLLYFQFEGNDLSSNFLGTRYGRDAISVQYYSEAASGTKSVDCSVQRGNSGKWVHNWEVANRTHYKLPGTYSNWHFAEHQFQPTTDNPFRLATAWQWEDDLCPVSLINNEKFCDLMHDLDLRRFLIMGDSLSVQFAISFLALVGRVPSQSEGSFRGLLKAPFQVKCAARMPSANSTSRTAFNVEIYIIRRSPIADLVGLCLGAKSAVTPGEVPWDAKVRDFLFKDDSRAAIVFNTGIWLQAGIDEFKTGFHCFVDWIDSLFHDTERSIDNTNQRILAFFRPTMQNHLDCEPFPQNASSTAQEFNWTGNPVRQVPYLSYQDYIDANERVLAGPIEQVVENGNTISLTADGVRFNNETFGKVSAYNEYAKTFLNRRWKNQIGDYAQVELHNASVLGQNISSSIPIIWLNTYNSTILRHDGHVGMGDCLHYSQPGPVDWWVHFLYSTLLEFRDPARHTLPWQIWNGLSNRMSTATAS